MTNSILENAKLAEFLDCEGAIDGEDGECFGKLIVTADTLQDFKDSSASYRGVEVEKFGDVELTVLNNFQIAKGHPRGRLFYINFNNDAQNIVIIY